jgi:hypothetical protein
MTLPVTGQIQFMPPGGATLTVDSITDPNGGPVDVIDVDQGFTVAGNVVLPSWLGGTATVCIWADEQGGPIDRVLSPCDTNSTKTYQWSITFGGTVLPDPQTSPEGSQIYHLLAKFMYEGQGTDIAGFADMGYYLIN